MLLTLLLLAVEDKVDDVTGSSLTTGKQSAERRVCENSAVDGWDRRGVACGCGCGCHTMKMARMTIRIQAGTASDWYSPNFTYTSQQQQEQKQPRVSEATVHEE